MSLSMPTQYIRTEVIFSRYSRRLLHKHQQRMTARDREFVVAYDFKCVPGTCKQAVCVVPNTAL